MQQVTTLIYCLKIGGHYTDFSRYLLGLRKLTQDIPKDRWNWVPLLDLETEWTDKKLAKHFGLTEKEQEHIKKKVQEWS